MDEFEERIEKVKKILAKHDIKMDVSGCGCCGSPWVTFEYKGKRIIDNEDYCDITMLEGDPHVRKC